MQTPTLSKDKNEKSNNAGLLSKMTLGVLSLGFLLALPSGILAWFDGLPWTGEAETLVLSVIIPFLLILRWQFLSFRFSILFLCALLLLKVVLFFGSPSGGLLVKVHPTLPKENVASYYPFHMIKGETWVKTYATSWNKKASGVHRASWDERMDFPLDWVLLKNNKCKLGSQTSRDCFEALSVVIEIEGALLIPKGKKFSLIARGVQEGTLIATNEHGSSFVLTPAKHSNDAADSQYQLPSDGRWKISGKLNYMGFAWSFVPVLVGDNGQVTKNLSRDVLWQSDDDLLDSLNRVGFYKSLSMIVDTGIVMFILAWIISAMNHMIQRGVLNWTLSMFSLLAISTPFILASSKVLLLEKFLSIVRLSDPTKVVYIGVSIIFAGIGFLFSTQKKKDYRNFQDDRIIPSIVLLFGPALLIFFSNKWYSSLGQWKYWAAGNDWVSYQEFAHKIVVEGEWLRAGETVFVLQPFYRYVVGVYHWLFGQSAFVQNMSDVWCVLGATFLIAGFAIKLRIAPLLIFISSLVYLSINLLGAFRYHIGRGLVEYTAMIFMILAAWFLYRSREGGIKPIVLATLFGILGYWTRQDHLGAVACLAFLVLEPVTGLTGGWKGYWDRFQFHWKKFTVYWGFGISSVLLICYRNWFMGGKFYPTVPGHHNFKPMDFSDQINALYIVIAGNTLPNIPSISGLVTAFGTCIALVALVWRPKALLNFPLSIGIIIIGLLVPYLFVWNWAYLPRFSIHLLPLAVLSVIFLSNHLLVGLKLTLRFGGRDKKNPY
jgi:hypothetical protein